MHIFSWFCGKLLGYGDMALMIAATPEFATESIGVIVAIQEVWMR